MRKLKRRSRLSRVVRVLSGYALVRRQTGFVVIIDEAATKEQQGRQDLPPVGPYGV